MKSARTCALLILGLSAFAHPQAVAADPPESTQWIVTTARATGFRGEEYWSTLRFVNLSQYDAPLSLTLLPQTPLDASGSAFGDASAASTVDIVVPAGQKVINWDPLALFGRSSGVGAIRIVSTGTDPQGKPIPVSAMSMTMTLPAGTVWPAPSVTGPLIPAQGPDALVGVGEPASIPFLWLGGGSVSGSYRSNILLASTNADSSTVVRLTLVDAANTVRTTREITLGPLAQTQVNNVYRYFDFVPTCPPCPSGDISSDEVRIDVSVLSGGPIAVAGSVIDDVTSASFHVPAVKRPTP